MYSSFAPTINLLGPRAGVCNHHLMTMPVHISTTAFWSWPLSFLPMTKQDAVNGSNITSGKLEGVGVTPIYNDIKKNESETKKSK